jgi:hypothetical protein
LRSATRSNASIAVGHSAAAIATRIVGTLRELKQPGEKAPGKYHYNPGSMSGKTVKTGDEGSEKKNEGDKLRSRDELPKEPS